MSDIRGRVRACELHTVSGDISIDLEPEVGGRESHLKTISGDVEVGMLTSSCICEYHTASGDLEVEAPARIMREGRKDRTVVIGDGRSRLSVRTVSGDLVDQAGLVVGGGGARRRAGVQRFRSPKTEADQDPRAHGPDGAPCRHEGPRSPPAACARRGDRGRGRGQARRDAKGLLGAKRRGQAGPSASRRGEDRRRAGLPSSARSRRCRRRSAAPTARAFRASRHAARATGTADRTGRTRTHPADPRDRGRRAEGERRHSARDRAGGKDEARVERSRARTSWEIRHRSRRAAPHVSTFPARSSTSPTTRTG